jgi:nicotinate dehydrogenase subunit A
MISAKVLLDRNPDPDMDAIRIALQDNLCRCGTHSRVFRAVRRAARELAR